MDTEDILYDHFHQEMDAALDQLKSEIAEMVEERRLVFIWARESVRTLRMARNLLDNEGDRRQVLCRLFIDRRIQVFEKAFSREIEIDGKG